MNYDGRRRYTSASPITFLEFLRKRATSPELVNDINNFALTAVGAALGSTEAPVEKVEDVSVVFTIIPGNLVLRSNMQRRVRGYRWTVSTSVPGVLGAGSYCFLTTDTEDCFTDLYLEDDVMFWHQ